MGKIIGIFATTPEGAIGYTKNKNQLPFDEPKDREFFREMTKDKIVICGRITAETLPESVKDNFKEMIILSRKSKDNNIDKVVERCRETEDEDFYLIGGAHTITSFIDNMDECYVTYIPYKVKYNISINIKQLKRSFGHYEDYKLFNSDTNPKSMLRVVRYWI